MAELLHVGPAGPDDICERRHRCSTARRLRVLEYDDGSVKAVCPDCMTFDEWWAEQEQFDGDVAELAVELEELYEELPGDEGAAQDARRHAAEGSAGLGEVQELHGRVNIRVPHVLPTRVPNGWRLMHSDERVHWDPPGIDGYLASLVKDAVPDLLLEVCDCAWAPGLVHYRADPEEA